MDCALTKLQQFHHQVLIGSKSRKCLVVSWLKSFRQADQSQPMRSVSVSTKTQNPFFPSILFSEGSTLRTLTSVPFSRSAVTFASLEFEVPAEAGRLDSRVTLLLLLEVPGLPAPSPQLENWIVGCAPALPSVPPPLCVPVHPPLRTLCGILRILGCCAEAPLFCCACLPVVDGRRETEAAFRSSFSSGSSFMSRIC